MPDTGLVTIEPGPSPDRPRAAVRSRATGGPAPVTDDPAPVTDDPALVTDAAGGTDARADAVPAGPGPGSDGVDEDGDEAAGRDADWAWVEEWRESGEPPAWAPGLTVAVFTALIVGLAVLVLSTGLSDLPWLAVAANVLVAAGLAPALWLSRRLPVLRWISVGAAAGVVIGWIGALVG